VSESDIVARIRAFATSPAARGLEDDAALFDGMVVTHDSIAEGVHFLPFDPPSSVGWKLVAVNLSDLAAKGAKPAAALLSMTIGDPEWDSAFLGGIAAACESYCLDLIGGDTIALPSGAPRVLGMTAIGKAGERVPSRAGGRPGDALWLVGTIGDSAAGLAKLQADRKSGGPLVDVYRRPVPLLAAGQALAPHAHAMMDVSDGLLLDAHRLAQASRVTVTIDLDLLPLSDDYVEDRGDSTESRLFAATGGDDYALLAALPADFDPLMPDKPAAAVRIGELADGPATVSLRSGGAALALPDMLGFEHGS
jgi:thiamine-monophosphate kinase